MAEKYKGKSDLGAVHLWREDLPVEIRAVLNDSEDVFLKDLPPRLPPICKGHEFKIELENNTPPVHQPLYKLSPLELAKQRSRSSICSSMDSSDHRTLPMAPQSYSHRRRMADYVSGLIISG